METDRTEYIRVRLSTAASCVEIAAKMIRELVSGEYADMADEAISLEEVATQLDTMASEL